MRMVNFTEQDFLIDEYNNVTYMKDLHDDTVIVDENGNKEPLVWLKGFTSPEAQHAIYIFEYMKKRVFQGDLVCAQSNVGTIRERWWIAGPLSPAGRLYSSDGTFSCRIQDAVALKSLDLQSLFEDESDYAEWLTRVTSLNFSIRKDACRVLASLIKNRGEHASDPLTNQL